MKILFGRGVLFLGILSSSFSAAHSQTSNTTIFTPNGVFLSCENAAKYRDTALFNEFDALYNVYEEKSLRYEKTLDELKEDLQEAQNLFKSATEKQRRDIKIGVARIVALKAIEKVIITDNVKKILNTEEIAALSLFIDQGAGLIEQGIREELGQPIDVIQLPRPLIEAIVKIHPYGNLIVDVFSVSEAILTAVWKWGPVRAYASEDAKQLAKAISILESKTPKIQIQNLNKTKNTIDRVCGTGSSYSVEDIIKQLGEDTSGVLTKNAAQNVLVQLLGASDIKDSDKKLTEVILREVGLAPENSSIPEAVLLNFLDGKSFNKQSADVEIDCAEISSTDSKRQVEDNDDPTSTEVEDCKEDEWDGEFEKTPIQIAIESAITAEEERVTQCGLDPNLPGCSLVASGNVARPELTDAPITIEEMNRRMGTVLPSQARDDIWQPEEIKSRTRGVIKEVCDEFGQCKTEIEPIKPIRADGRD